MAELMRTFLERKIMWVICLAAAKVRAKRTDLIAFPLPECPRDGIVVTRIGTLLANCRVGQFAVAKNTHANAHVFDERRRRPCDSY